MLPQVLSDGVKLHAVLVRLIGLFPSMGNREHFVLKPAANCALKCQYAFLQPATSRAVDQTESRERRDLAMIRKLEVAAVLPIWPRAAQLL